MRSESPKINKTNVQETLEPNKLSLKKLLRRGIISLGPSPFLVLDKQMKGENLGSIFIIIAVLSAPFGNNCSNLVFSTLW